MGREYQRFNYYKGSELGRLPRVGDFIADSETHMVFSVDGIDSEGNFILSDESGDEYVLGPGDFFEGFYIKR